jgi:hypothetical protein
VADVGVGLLALAQLGTPFACWFMLARVPAIRWGVCLVLLLLVAPTVGLYVGWIDTRAQVELILGYAPASAAIIGVGMLLQRKHARDLPPLRPHRTKGKVLLLIYVSFMVLCCSPVAVRAVNEPFTPPDSELIPLPSGLVLIDDQDLGCGSGDCSRSFSIGSTDGASTNEIVAAVWKHLEVNHGWADSTTACRPQGWLLDHSELCVEVDIGPSRQVHVLFDGARD